MNGALAAYRVAIFLTKDSSSLTELAHQILGDDRLSEDERDALLPLIPLPTVNTRGPFGKKWASQG